MAGILPFGAMFIELFFIFSVSTKNKYAETNEPNERSFQHLPHVLKILDGPREFEVEHKFYDFEHLTCQIYCSGFPLF